MKTAKFYDKFMSDMWRRDLRYVNYRVEAIKKIIYRFVPKDSRVLELGCGNGLVTSHLARRAKSVLAIDLSEQAIANAKRYVNKSNCTFRAADIVHDDIADDIFDVIVAADVMEHIEHRFRRRTIISALENRLAEDGTVILTWPHPDAQKESDQIVEEPVDIAELLPLTSMKLFYLAYVDVDGKNQYVHCILKKNIAFVPTKRSFTKRSSNAMRKIFFRLENLRIIAKGQKD